MQKVKIKQTLTVHGGEIAVTEDQARRRAHKLEELKKQPKGLDEGFTAYAVSGDVQFKVGEELYVSEIEKSANPFVYVDESDVADDDQVNDSDVDQAGPVSKKKSSKKKASKRSGN